MENIFQGELARVREQGRTVLLSSHMLSEVEKACDRVSIVRGGVIVDSGTLTELRHLTRTTVRATMTSPPTAADLAGWPGVYDTGVSGNEVHLAVDTEAIGATISRLDAGGITALTVQPPTLEELFLERYHEEVPSAPVPSEA